MPLVKLLPPKEDTRLSRVRIPAGPHHGLEDGRKQVGDMSSENLLSSEGRFIESPLFPFDCKSYEVAKLQETLRSNAEIETIFLPNVCPTADWVFQDSSCSGPQA